MWTSLLLWCYVYINNLMYFLWNVYIYSSTVDSSHNCFLIQYLHINHNRITTKSQCTIARNIKQLWVTIILKSQSTIFRLIDWISHYSFIRKHIYCLDLLFIFSYFSCFTLLMDTFNKNFNCIYLGINISNFFNCRIF